MKKKESAFTEMLEKIRQYMSLEEMSVQTNF